MPLIFNKKGTKAQILANADETVNLVDLNVDDEEVFGFTITAVYWSVAGGGTASIERGGDTVLSLSGSGRLPFYQDNVSIGINSDQPMEITVPANSTVIVEVRKQSAWVSQYYGR